MGKSQCRISNRELKDAALSDKQDAGGGLPRISNRELKAYLERTGLDPEQVRASQIEN